MSNITGKTEIQCYLPVLMYFLSSEDLSKSEDKDDLKKEGEDGKAAKKADDPEVNCAFKSISSTIFTSVIVQEFDDISLLILSLTQIIEIPDENEKSPVLEKKEEADAAAEKEDKEKETVGDQGKEKEADDTSKEKEEKLSAAVEKDISVDTKGDGSESKTDSEEGRSKGEAVVIVLTMQQVLKAFQAAK